MDYEQLTDLINRNGDTIYSFCRYLTYSKEDAEDLYQDTLLLAVRNCGKINPDENPSGFLTSMAIRVWKSNKRKYARRNRIAQYATFEEAYLVADERNTEEILIDKELFEYIRSEVRLLGDKYSIPIYMYYTLELNIGEIAKVMKISAGTVKSRLHIARSRLKKALEVVDYART